MTAKALDDFRLLDKDTLAEPYAFWAAMRDTAPVHKVDEGIGYYVVTRYADVLAAIRNPAVFSNQLSLKFPSGMSAFEDSPAVKEVMKSTCPYQDVLSFSDGEIHDKHRRMVRRGFSTKRVRELEDFVTLTVDELLDELVTGDPVDLWGQFAKHVPVRVIAHILGLPADREDDVRRWADAQVARLGEAKSEDEELKTARDLVDFHQYLYAAIRERRGMEKDDFLSDMVQAAEGISDDELVLVSAQLVVAGAESTISLIGNMVDRLLDNPLQLESLRAEPRLIVGVVEETLRTESPIKLVHRITTEDVEVAGTVIPANSVVLLMLAAANRDERTFVDPERFDAERADARKHFAFGMGTHLCSGAELARSEARIAISRLLERTSEITRVNGAERPVHPPNMTVRALDRLPVRLVPSMG